MSIENFKTFDPFADADEDNVQTQNTAQEYIHIRIQQRNGRKTLTTVQGIPPKFDLKKILKQFKRTFACNGTIIDDVKDKDKKDDELPKDPAQKDSAVEVAATPTAAVSAKETKDDDGLPKDPAQKDTAVEVAATPTAAVSAKETKDDDGLPKDDDGLPKDPAQKDAAVEVAAATPTAAVSAKETKDGKDKTSKSSSKPTDKEKRSIGDVVQLQGDQRKNTREFLIKTLGLDAKTIKVHGF